MTNKPVFTANTDFPYDHIHIVGIGGIGVSRLARYFLAQGKKVSGSDLKENETVKDLVKEGVEFFSGHDEKNLPEGCGLLIYTIAIPENNPERLAAKSRGIKEISHFEALGIISRGFKTVAVAGTNGKSTTTAILGLILEAAAADPTVFIGSKLAGWNSNIRVGKGDFMVVEADELQRQFLSLSPYAVVITNIEADHLDYYKDLNDISSAFSELISKLPLEGFLVYNQDDLLSKVVAASVKSVPKISYGSGGANVSFQNIKIGDQTQEVEIKINSKKKTSFKLKIPGKFNVYNALAAIATADYLGVDWETIKKTLESFQGIWRRFERVGYAGKTLIISDYAHHPTSLLGTIEAAKQFFPGQKILFVFQPHQYARTKIMLDDFAQSLINARPENLMLVEVFDVAGRESGDGERVSSLDLLEKISRKISNVEFISSLREAEAKIRKLLPRYDVIVFMGAGDIYQVAENLAAKKTTAT